MNIFTDAHVHLADIFERDPVFAVSWLEDDSYIICAASHSPAEFTVQESFVSRYPERIFSSYGVHPQGPKAEYLPFLERLLREGRIDAVGETGFDLFTEEYAREIDRQEEVWAVQIELAGKYEKPVVIHSRHALDRIFRDSAKLRKLPAVIFHSWPGSPVEGESLLKRGINAYFSLGKGLLNNNKRMIRSIQSLPRGRVLLETDAPWQTLKGEDWTRPEDIKLVYRAAAELCGMEITSLCSLIHENFERAFCLDQLP